jgi:general secretion pathway protein D
MRFIYAIFLTLFTTFAQAQNVNLDMQQVPLLEFSQAVLKGILDRDYVLSTESELQRKITVQLKNQTPDQVLAFLRSQLQKDNHDLIDHEGILHIEKIETLNVIENTDSKPDSQNTIKTDNAPPVDFYYYQSKHRPLTDFPSFFTTIGAAGAGAAQSVTVDGDAALIRGRPDFVKLAKTIIAQYDRPLNEIEIKASIVEYSTTDQTNIGIFTALKLLDGKLDFQLGNNTTQRDFVSFGTSSFKAVLSAISNDSHFNILETSTMRLVSGKVGRINVGQEVPVLGQITLDQSGRPIQSVSYRASGLLVDIKPVVVGTSVHADIDQQLSSFAVTNTSTIDSPTLLKRQLTTSLTAPFNEVILIGGLDEQKDTKAVATLFGLPLGKNDTVTKTSLFLILEFSKR